VGERPLAIFRKGEESYPLPARLEGKEKKKNGTVKTQEKKKRESTSSIVCAKKLNNSLFSKDCGGKIPGKKGGRRGR